MHNGHNLPLLSIYKVQKKMLLLCWSWQCVKSQSVTPKSPTVQCRRAHSVTQVMGRKLPPSTTITTTSNPSHPQLHPATACLTSATTAHPSNDDKDGVKSWSVQLGRSPDCSSSAATNWQCQLSVSMRFMFRKCNSFHCVQMAARQPPATGVHEKLDVLRL